MIWGSLREAGVLFDGGAMNAAAVSANPRAWPAGYPFRSHPLSPVLTVALLALVFTAFAVVAASKRRSMEPVKQEMQPRPVMASWSRVDVKANILGVMLDANGRFHLTVRDGGFEVRHPFVLARFLFGQDYCYRAADTTIRVVPGFLGDWIEIEGQPAGRIRIRQKNMNRQIWDALIRAGARPIGSSPPQ
jgi:hypothetical protein